MTSVIHGILMGDGYMSINTKQRSVNPCLYLGQSLDHFGYLWFSFMELAPMHNKVPGFRSSYDRRTKNTAYGAQFITRSYPCLHPIYSMWYNNKVKVLPPIADFYEIFNSVVLAHLIMGDGGRHGNGLRISVQGFTPYEVNLIASVLIYKFGIGATLHTKVYPSGVKYYLYIRTASMPLLASLVIPYMHVSMAYKLGEHWQNYFNGGSC